MNYVILRDDDTCALTPVRCLEHLYRPFLDRGLPVNLAVIPQVNTRATWADGSEEGFLFAKRGNEPSHLPIGTHHELLEYLLANPGFECVHHGFEHTYLEFNSTDRASLARRLDGGARRFSEAGLTPPKTFVAPYDQISRAAYLEIAKRFRTVSTGWFELGRTPHAWWPQLLLAKATQRPHWRTGRLNLLSHAGCMLSHKRSLDTMVPLIRETVRKNRLTVLVTHWWEYFHRGKQNDAFIHALHQTADMLANLPDTRVIPFSALEDPTSPIAREILDGQPLSTVKPVAPQPVGTIPCLP